MVLDPFYLQYVILSPSPGDNYAYKLAGKSYGVAGFKTMCIHSLAGLFTAAQFSPDRCGLRKCENHAKCW